MEGIDYGAAERLGASIVEKGRHRRLSLFAVMMAALPRHRRQVATSSDMGTTALCAGLYLARRSAISSHTTHSTCAGRAAA